MKKVSDMRPTEWVKQMEMEINNWTYTGKTTKAQHTRACIAFGYLMQLANYCENGGYSRIDEMRRHWEKES